MYGSDFTANEAGSKYDNLLNQEWRTNEVLEPLPTSTATNLQFSFRGFLGSYKLKLTGPGIQNVEKVVEIGKQGGVFCIASGNANC